MVQPDRAPRGGPIDPTFEPPRPAGAVVLPPATHTCLLRAASALSEAMGAAMPHERYALAHVAALRAAAAVIAAKEAPTGRRTRERNAWVLLTRAAPDMADWAAFFASGAGTYAAAQAGSRRAVSAESAEELIEEADRFLRFVELSLGLVPHAWNSRDGQQGSSGVA